MGQKDLQGQRSSPFPWAVPPQAPAHAPVHPGPWHRGGYWSVGAVNPWQTQRRGWLSPSGLMSPWIRAHTPHWGEGRVLSASGGPWPVLGPASAGLTGYADISVPEDHPQHRATRDQTFPPVGH